MASGLDRELASGLRRRAEAGLLRRLESATSSRDSAGSDAADFTSNDYLGLSRHPELLRAAREAVETHGAGGRASRLLGGGGAVHEQAEGAAAAWLGAEAALLFPTGFQANLGAVTALAGPGDVILSDRRNHASLVDAARLSRARVAVHDPGDLGHLERLLRGARSARRRLVLTEGVFSMQGTAAPLREIDALCRRHDAWLLVDEAHAAGLLGPGGGGAVDAVGADDLPRLAARVVTGGKALGAAGAFVVGSSALREHLVNHARSFVYTTAAPPAVAGALLAAIARCRGDASGRARALGLARRLAAELDLPAPAAALVPVPMPDVERALAAEADLRGRGLDVRAVRPPTVPTPRLRIVCHAFNADAEVARLAAALRPHLHPRPRAGARRAPAAARVAPALFVVGTDTGVGKTVVAALLLRAARRRGAARYWKPVQTGAESDTAVVVELAGAPVDETPRPAYAFPLPASPHEAAREAGARVDPAHLRAELAAHRAGGDLWIVELAGGLHVPLDGAWTQADWLAAERVPVVLVARSGLGTLNHTLLTLEALQARNLSVRALFLVGAPHASNRATLAELGGLPVVELPLLDPLDGAALERWIDTHAGDREMEAVLDP